MGVYCNSKGQAAFSIAMFVVLTLVVLLFLYQTKRIGAKSESVKYSNQEAGTSLKMGPAAPRLPSAEREAM